MEGLNWGRQISDGATALFSPRIAPPLTVNKCGFAANMQCEIWERPSLQNIWFTNKIVKVK